MKKLSTGKDLRVLSQAQLLLMQAYDNLGKARSMLWTLGLSDMFSQPGGETAEDTAGRINQNVLALVHELEEKLRK